MAHVCSDRWSVRQFAVLVLLLIVGCGSSRDINDVYGRRRGGGTRSVNGTAVLGEMFHQAGFRVSSWRRLSPKLEHDQVILWAPDHFEAPPHDVVEYLESWLSASNDRTLVYVARDFTASVDFWQQIMAAAPPQQRIEIRRKIAQIKSDHVAAKNRAFSRSEDAMKCNWFTLEDDEIRAVDGRSLRGPWSDGIEANRLSIELATKVTLPTAEEHASLDVRTLLDSQQGVLAAELSRGYWQGSKIIVVANGSWLLNLPLVNPEHRVLAELLIAECGPPANVCFLESGPQGLRISDSDANLPLMLRAFTVWPVNAILLHLTVLGIIFCFAIFPIFGRPQQLDPDSVSDFGKHVAAVGDLLERGGDQIHARHRLQIYQELNQPKHAATE